MILLLDTHALIWASDEPAKLSNKAKQALSDLSNELRISAISIMEISIKVGIGKLRLSMPFRPWIESAITTLDLKVIPISIGVAERQIQLPPHHGDPFDRWLIAESFESTVPIVSSDTKFDLYSVNRLW